MAKKIAHGKESQQDAGAALSKIATLVGSTLGPKGRTILTSKRNSGNQISVTATKDGLNVLQSMTFTDPVEDAVHKLCVQASANSVIDSGDGTTSTLLCGMAFARALLVGSNNPQAEMRVFQREVKNAIEAISAEAVHGPDACRKVALTSTNGDVELTDVVLDALKDASAYSTVLIEKNPTQKERYKVDREFGYQASQGYGYCMPLAQSISQTVTSNAEFGLRDCYVVPYNGDILALRQIASIITKLGESSKINGKPKLNLFVVCYEASESVAFELAQLNSQNPGIKIFLGSATPTQEFNGRYQQLNDICAYSGAKLVDAGNVEYWTAADAGKVKIVRVTTGKTYILGKGENEFIARRAQENEKAAVLAPSQMDREIINSRNSSLTGGLVKITVGDGLFSELYERADRADDAIKACQSAMRSGSLPGCGASYIRAGQLAKVSDKVQNALSVIHRQIMENCGETPLTSFEKGQTVYISDEGEAIPTSDFLAHGVADSLETVKAVLKHGSNLGMMIASLGGYVLEMNTEELEQAARLAEMLRN